MLQLELGYTDNFHTPGVRAEYDTAIAIRFAVSSRFLVEADIDAMIAQSLSASQTSATGFGDCQFGIQTVLFHEHESSPGVALAYYIKVPTASGSNGLRTGKSRNHNFIALVSKTFDKTTFDFNAIYLLAGRTSRNGHWSRAAKARSPYPRD